MPDVVAHTFDPSTREAKAGGSLWVPGQPGLQSEFQDSQGYPEKPYLQKPNNNKNFESALALKKLTLGGGEMVQLGECLPNKLENLS